MKTNDNKKIRGKNNTSGKYYGLFFLSTVVFLYLLLGVSDPKSLIQSLIISGRLILRIIPVLLFVVLLMGVINYFTSPRAITTYLRKKPGYKRWLFAIIAGILSHGPVYAWYPLLKDLFKQGMRSELIALFLYCRAIKIPLLPLMAYYFGIGFTILFITYVICAGLIEGKIFELFIKEHH